jgi:hypothetical protein
MCVSLQVPSPFTHIGCLTLSGGPSLGCQGVLSGARNHVDAEGVQQLLFLTAKLGLQLVPVQKRREKNSEIGGGGKLLHLSGS